MPISLQIRACALDDLCFDLTKPNHACRFKPMETVREPMAFSVRVDSDSRNLSSSA